jgi:hypothetical protein
VEGQAMNEPKIIGCLIALAILIVVAIVYKWRSDEEDDDA